MGRRNIEGQVALITGAARGIGKATALAMIERGVKVALTDIDATALEQTHAVLAELDAEVVAYPLDVTDLEAFRAVVERTQHDLGPLDILINNAGIMAVGRFAETEARMDDRMIDINVRGVLHGARAVLPVFEERGKGHLVNMASSAGKFVAPRGAVYCATKHAVVGFSDALIAEYERSAIDISYVMPGLVRTELTAGASAMRYPPALTPEQVAAAVIDVLETGRTHAFVPGFAQLSALLPALLPRTWVRQLGQWFGVDRVFQVDDDERADYRARIQE
ncbi:MAG: SDR family NAD(P)-dependent oxidoreductase [Myxococcota bacterium]